MGKERGDVRGGENENQNRTSRRKRIQLDGVESPRPERLGNKTKGKEKKSIEKTTFKRDPQTKKEEKKRLSRQAIEGGTDHILRRKKGEGRGEKLNSANIRRNRREKEKDTSFFIRDSSQKSKKSIVNSMEWGGKGRGA